MNGDAAPRPVARAKHGDLSLDQIAEIQPGMARLMLEVSERYWSSWYAAHVRFGYPYIEWQLPDAPPPHLRLAPRRPGT